MPQTVYCGSGSESINAVERTSTPSSWRAKRSLKRYRIEEQRRIYELFYQAGLRAKAGDFSQPAIATTVSNGSDNRIDDECAAASA